MERFDILILGAGPAGYVAAIRAAQLKKRVCVIEKAEVGGTCLNRGCIPTKSLIASANLFSFIKRASEFGISVENAAVNFKAVQERKKKVVDSGIKGIKSLFKRYGIALEYGVAGFKEPFAVEIRKGSGETKILSGDKIIISTGSRPSDIPGVIADNKHIFDSDSILETDNLPASLTIIGGGAVGCEFAHIFNSFGVKVNIIELMPHLIPLEDEDISCTLEREFKKKGIKIFLGKRVERVLKGEGEVKIVLSDGIEIESERLLLSVGRRFNTAGLGIENTGVKTGEKGNILVDDKMESSVSGVYAAGDVAGRAMLAYVASKEGIVAAENASGIEGKMDYSVIPSTVFTEPEIGCVGLKEREAVESSIKIAKGFFQFRALGRSHASGEISGMVKVISDAGTDKVLGVHIIGAHASEMVHEAVVAIKMGMRAKELEDTIHAHPVFSEGIMEAAADVHGRAIHKL
ncbi:MAG: dihydrolipoyl dehydrogenase [Nitrospinae bacterium]|nr:dihydrolipoyl dehydrogenase [Nitrospinota bacterium]